MICLNAPFGARCFQTRGDFFRNRHEAIAVLMHRLVRAADGTAKMLHVIPGLLFQRLKSDRRYSAIFESRYRVERREFRAKLGVLGAF